MTAEVASNQREMLLPTVYLISTPRLFNIYPKIPEISVRMWIIRQFWLGRRENFRDGRNGLKGGPKISNQNIRVEFITAILEL